MTHPSSCQECGSSQLVKIDTYKRHYYFCDSCGSGAPVQKDHYPLQFLPVKDWTKTDTDEESMYDYFVDPSHIEYSLETARDITEKYIKKWNIPVEGKTILDVSAGNGHFINEFKKMGATVSMTEINDPSIDYARKTHGIEVYKYNYNTDALQDVIQQKYDIVMERASIMFCKDFAKHAKDLTSIVKPGGLVFINHSVVPTLGVVLRTQVDEFSYFSLRSPEQVIRHMNAAGFELVERLDETDPSLYVYDHDLKLRWWLLHIFYEWKGILTLRTRHRKFGFPARDRRRSTMLFRYKST